MLGESMAAPTDPNQLVISKAHLAVEMLPPPPVDRSQLSDQEILYELRERVEDTLENPVPAVVNCLCDGLAGILSHLTGTPRRERQSRQLQVSPPRRNRTRVLLADNDPTVGALLTSTLGNHEMDCVVESTGGAVLTHVRDARPDVVVLSVNLEELDGFQVLAAIKRDPLIYSTKVVMLTSRRTEVDVVRAFGLGADDYVTKPFSPMELAMRIRRLVGKIEI
jgi:CheY-like chemotaxis protein